MNSFSDTFRGFCDLRIFWDLEVFLRTRIFQGTPFNDYFIKPFLKKHFSIGSFINQAFRKEEPNAGNAGKYSLNIPWNLLENSEECSKGFGGMLLKIFRYIFRNSHRKCSVKNGVLRNFAKFKGTHLCQSLFFNKVAGPCSCFCILWSLAHFCSVA